MIHKNAGIQSLVYMTEGNRLRYFSFSFYVSVASTNNVELQNHLISFFKKYSLKLIFRNILL